MQSLIRFAIQRGVRALLSVWLVITAVFVILRLSGDPVSLLLGDTAPPEQIAALRKDLGLDQSIAVQYERYFVRLGHGDLGSSLRFRRPAARLVLDRFPATLQLAMTAFIASTVLGLTLGIFAAVGRSSLWDRGIVATTSLLQSGPPFFLGILLILLFSVRLQWLPSSGSGGITHLALPALTLSLASIAGIVRLTRSAFVEVLRSEYIRTARAKGLDELRIVLRHALRNAAPPLVNLFALELAALLSGAVIVEVVFAWPGLGRLAVDAVSARDYPVVQAAVLYVALLFVVLNFAADCLSAGLDPRVTGV